MSKENKYGFYGRLNADFPSQIIIDVTEVCNLACVHCPHPEFKKSEYYDTRHLNPILNKKIIDEVRDYGQGKTQYIRYTSDGEPLIHPKAYDMVEYAVVNSGVFVTLTTNGTIMNEKRIRKLLDSGVHMIDISIDAYSSDIYEKIRLNGNLEVTRQNVLDLIKWVKQANLQTKIVVSYIEQPQNLHETELFKKYWEEQGVHSVVVRRLHSAAGAVIKVADIMRKEQAGKIRRPCLYPWERIVLNPRGYLSFCPADWTHGSTVIDYQSEHVTVSKVWKDTFYQNLRNAHINNSYENHNFCGQCPDWNQIHWPSSGELSYADLVQEMKGL
jgi:MoaA/NifB/PqqE/SkfB family radical SAM enzyme